MTAAKSRSRPKADTESVNRQRLTLRELPALLSRHGSFLDVVDSLRSGQAGAIDGAWGSSAALVVAALAAQTDKPLIVVLPRMHDVDEFADDLFNFLGDVPAIFPAWENWPRDDSATDPVSGARLRVLRAIIGDTPPRAIVTSGPALMQPVPRRCDLEAATRTIKVGESL